MIKIQCNNCEIVSTQVGRYDLPKGWAAVYFGVRSIGNRDHHLGELCHECAARLLKDFKLKEDLDA